MRFIANDKSKLIHDRHAAGERCNVDDLEHGRDVDVDGAEDLLRAGRQSYSLCRHCFADDRFGKWAKTEANSA